MPRTSILLLCAGLSLTSAGADDRPAGTILAEIRAIERPGLAESKARRATLIGELYAADPSNPELVALLPERWQTRMFAGAGEAIRAEVAAVLASTKVDKLGVEAAFILLQMELWAPIRDGDLDPLNRAAEAFIARAPKDERGAMALGAIAGRTADPARIATLNGRIVAEYPDSPGGRALVNARRQAESIGKPFELEFVDAISGSTVRMADLKGKVVILDFWATWCNPCVAEMPELKKLYAEYKPQGVEFIGVSLDIPRDQGGYEALRRFVEKDGIGWPQYYEGKTSAADFANAWGVQAVPVAFAIDADGNLASTEARGKLGTLIPELLARARKPTTGSTP